MYVSFQNRKLANLSTKKAPYGAFSFQPYFIIEND